jgi:hypothetical protein
MKRKYFSVFAVKAYSGTGGMVPLFFNLDFTRGKETHSTLNGSLGGPQRRVIRFGRGDKIPVSSGI